MRGVCANFGVRPGQRLSEPLRAAGPRVPRRSSASRALLVERAHEFEGLRFASFAGAHRVIRGGPVPRVWPRALIARQARARPDGHQRPGSRSPQWCCWGAASRTQTSRVGQPRALPGPGIFEASRWWIRRPSTTHSSPRALCQVHQRPGYPLRACVPAEPRSVSPGWYRAGEGAHVEVQAASRSRFSWSITFAMMSRSTIFFFLRAANLMAAVAMRSGGHAHSEAVSLSACTSSSAPPFTTGFALDDVGSQGAQPGKRSSKRMAS